MEQDVSILIADLSGYTALTETHGSLAAADLIDKYIELVSASLVGDSHVQERVGDEVMIISTAADNLLATAEILLRSTLKEYNFLQLHGALHYGKLLKRNNSYFGSDLNLVSRIAAQANAGTLLCTLEFINALHDRSMYQFISKGKYDLKNVTDEKELFEINLKKPADLYIDPVCRMIVNRKRNFLSHPDKADILFCSQDCLDIYINKYG